MPIRTNRGRAAVYRKLWGWPLRSPKHLVTTVVGVTVLATTIGVVGPRLLGENGPLAASGGTPGSGQGQAGQSLQPTGGQSQSAAPTGGAIPTSLPPSLPTRLSSPAASPSSAAPDPAALSVAESWGKAWVNHPDGMTNEQWLDQLRPYTTEEYLPVMSSVDIANIPATKVTGSATPTKSHANSMEAALPTDGGTLQLTLVRTAQGWRVARYTKAD
ncbi:hypothetical protein [Goodfellowiella coeruleoviolacea]|uniref:Uncharacterized protein n=1 Tax=Goodfellowiella coeruleoviolacea TaxID=334858 RepID=A0AAE3KIN3_9PSEU|nr:hypothetical protein [Goodfellowiella coeruleoviolacea]MCP2168172.1 hypothetical protein [Goodfellowiella coeruleoviolacea]